MPDFRIRASGEIITDLARAFPNVSIPLQPSAEDFDVLGVDPVLEGPQPTLAQFQSALRTGPEQDSLGNWMWVYTTIDWSAEAIASATNQQWESVRADRNARLLQSDWTQLTDAPLTSAQKSSWADYRQALRDVTAQPDPFNINWPLPPT